RSARKEKGGENPPADFPGPERETGQGPGGREPLRAGNDLLPGKNRLQRREDPATSPLRLLRENPGRTGAGQRKAAGVHPPGNRPGNQHPGLQGTAGRDTAEGGPDERGTGKGQGAGAQYSLILALL